MKRKNYISWDQFFMGIAKLAAQRSKDPNTQVGACITSDKKVVGVGYNGFPIGCSDNEFPWEASSDVLESKYTYVCHAELNAIINSIDRHLLRGATLYITLFPCNECAKLIIQSGITHIKFEDDKYYAMDMSIAARRMFDTVGVTYEKLG